MDALARGWSLYWQNVGPMVLIALTLIGIEIAVSVIGTAVGNGAAGLLFEIFTTVIVVLLGLGVIRASLAVAEGRAPSVGMLVITDGWGPYLLASILVGLGVLIGLFLLIVPGIILALMWEFYGFVIAEDPTISPVDALQRSAEITRGHRCQLLGLGLLLALINVVGLLACCVGLIFTSGIAWVTTACAYHTLSATPRYPG